MDSPLLSPFERSLLATPLTFVHQKEGGTGSEREQWAEIQESNRHLAETLLIRKQIDGFLGNAGKLDEIGALLLTIITEGRLFAYNRALLLLTDQQDGFIRGSAGIGALSKEEAWNLWAGILGEALDLEKLVNRAMSNFREQNRRLTPILEKLNVSPEQSDRFTDSFKDQKAAVLTRFDEGAQDGWLFNVLDTDEVGVVPMWGYNRHFGVLLVDNFASGRKVCIEGIQVLGSFVKPFINALERALVIEQYREKVTQLQEANARIESQQQMLLRMERKNTVGRFTATLAHNLLNPVLSMSGHLVKLRELRMDGTEKDRVLDTLLKDLRDLEEFVADFISQVHEEFPLRHYWDLNHLLGEVIASYSRFHHVLTPEIAFEEGDIPLVRLDYEKIKDSISTLMGITSLLISKDEGITVSTAREGPSVLLKIRGSSTFSYPAAHAGDRVRDELSRLEGFLTEDDVGLSVESNCFILIFRL